MLRWEFIFSLNLIIGTLWPLFSIGKGFNRFLVFLGTIGILFLTNLAFFVAWALQQSGDFWYQTKLFWLHLGPSVLCLSVLSLSAEGLAFAWLRLFGALFCSLSIAFLFFYLTPPMAAFDPFLGILPGPVDMDPIIDLEFYWTRFWGVLLGIVLIFVLGYRMRFRPVHIVVLLWLPILIFSQFFPSPYASRSKLESTFPSPSSDGSLIVFSHQEDSIRLHWLEEFQFLKSEIYKRLPANARELSQEPLSIFIYANDREKKEKIGAERTQIGNFLRGEMHLSELELDHPILEHELTHLIHGHLDAPIKTYIDPFWFEGLAVATTELDPQRARRQASALFRIFSIRGLPLEWPHLKEFFSALPPQASYRLAGAYATEALENSEWPWAIPKLSPDHFKQIEVSDEELAEASLIMSQKPLMKDPLRRDCARIYRDFSKRPTVAEYKRTLRICDQSPLAYEALFSVSENRANAFMALASSRYKDGGALQSDLAVISDNLNLVIQPSLCETADCRWRARFLKEKRHTELKRILLESKAPRVDLRRSFLPEPQAVKELAALMNRAERIKLYESVLKKRPLETNESFHYLKSRVYDALERGMSENQRKSFLSEANKFTGPAGDKLRRRLLFRAPSAD